MLSAKLTIEVQIACGCFAQELQQLHYLVSTEQIVVVIQVGQGGVMEGAHTS